MKSFLSGRPIASAEPLKSISVPPPANGAQSPSRHTAQPAHHTHNGANVECVKQGDKITRLIVTCTCGERIEIDCVYPTGH